jgi:NADH-quinone oxidoreductase subunit B
VSRAACRRPASGRIVFAEVLGFVAVLAVGLAYVWRKGGSSGSAEARRRRPDGAGFFATRVDALVNWGRKNSLWPMPLGLSCCGIELMALIGPQSSTSRASAPRPRASARASATSHRRRHADLEDGDGLPLIYDQMPEPKWVMAMGVCSSSGGMYDSYAVVQGVDSILPVDVYVPGCPPRPDAVLDALMKLQKKIERERPIARLLAGPDVVDERGTDARRTSRTRTSRSKRRPAPHDPRAARRGSARAPGRAGEATANGARGARARWRDRARGRAARRPARDLGRARRAATRSSALKRARASRR